jgi:hypothetical protein
MNFLIPSFGEENQCQKVDCREVNCSNQVLQGDGRNLASKTFQFRFYSHFISIVYERKLESRMRFKKFN